VRELGRHLILEFFECDPKVLDDMKLLEDMLLKAAEKAEVKVVGKAFHKFAPQGVTGIIIVAESHLSIHTWPEYGYAAIDIFTCGNTAKPEKAYEEIEKVLKPKRVSITEMKRGIIEVAEEIKVVRRA